MYIFATLRPPKKPQKLVSLINFDPLWACRNIKGHGKIILVEYGPWGPPGTRVMTIFVTHVTTRHANSY